MGQLTLKQLKFLADSVEGTWAQNPDSSISVKGVVDCSSQNLTSIPVQFSTVSGNFYCFNNQLTSLKGCPNQVLGYFDCSDNLLTSLEFCPSTISGNLYCYKNRLVTLEFCPKQISGNLYCHNNPVSKETLKLLFQARTVQKLSWISALANYYDKIPQKDLDIMKIPKDFKEKYRGNIAASNLGLI